MRRPGGFRLWGLVRIQGGCGMTLQHLHYLSHGPSPSCLTVYMSAPKASVSLSMLGESGSTPWPGALHGMLRTSALVQEVVGMSPRDLTDQCVWCQAKPFRIVGGRWANVPST